MIKVQIQFLFFLNRSTALPIRSTDASVLPITFLPVWGLLFAVVAAVFVLLEVLEFLLDVSDVEEESERITRTYQSSVERVNLMMNDNERRDAEIRSIMRLTLGKKTEKSEPKTEKETEITEETEKKTEKKSTKKADK